MTELTPVAEINVSYFPTISNKPIITTSLDAYEELRFFFPEEEIALKEQLVVMYLNNNNRVLGAYKLSSGGINRTIADTRLILAIGLKVVASGIIICHNHPSGNLKASNDDISVTKKIKEAAKLMDIRVLDHLIITPEHGYLSMADDGMM